MRTHGHLALIAVVVVLVGCDHATKHLAADQLQAAPPVEVVSGVLDLSYTENFDVAFGALRVIPEGTRYPLMLSVVFLAIPLLLAFWYIRRRAAWYEQLGYAVLLAGVLGNGLDRAFRGYVVDFIHVHYWPTFNVADICLTVGMVVFILTSLRQERLTALE